MSRIIHLFFFTQDCMQAMPHPTPDARRPHDANMLRRRHCLLTIPSTQSTHNGNSGFSSIIPPIFFFIQFSLPTNITHTTTSTRSNTGSIVLIRSYFFPFSSILHTPLCRHHHHHRHHCHFPRAVNIISLTNPSYETAAVSVSTIKHNTDSEKRGH